MKDSTNELDPKQWEPLGFEADNLHIFPGLCAELRSRLVFLAETLSDETLPRTDRPNQTFILLGEESEEYKRTLVHAFARTHQSLAGAKTVNVEEATLNDFVDDDRRVELIKTLQAKLHNNSRSPVVLFVGEQLDSENEDAIEILCSSLNMINALSPRVVCFVADSETTKRSTYFQTFAVDRPDFIGRREILVYWMVQQYLANGMFFPDLEDSAHLDEFSERTEGMGYEQLRRIIAGAVASYALSPAAPRYIGEMYNSIAEHSR